MCQIGVIRGIRRLGENTYERLIIPVRCNTWLCPECGPAKGRRLLRRALDGEICKDQSTSRYSVKLFTLTLDGKNFRAPTSNPRTAFYTGENGPETCYRLLMSNFNRLMASIRKYYGGCHYFRIVEAHRDGYPHIHLLLNGTAIADKGILGFVRRLWKGYGMGNVNVRPVDKGTLRETITYVMKYLLKDASKGKFYRTSRPVSWSRGALAAPVKVVSDWEGVSFSADSGPAVFQSEILEMDRHVLHKELWNMDALVDHSEFRRPYPTRVDQERFRSISAAADKALSDLTDWFAAQGRALSYHSQMPLVLGAPGSAVFDEVY